MKSFQQFIESIDSGLRGELEKSFGASSYSPDQEKSVATVVNIIMHAAATDMARLMTMLKTLSARDPSMMALYDQIDVSNLRAAAKKHTGSEDSDDNDNDDVINRSMNPDHMV
jgi:hypothetical protein